MRVAFFQNGRVLHVYNDVREITPKDQYFLVRTKNGDIYKVWGFNISAVEIPEGTFRKEE